jgi:16S rRNA (uracil1498-N3)-methyltransferase
VPGPHGGLRDAAAHLFVADLERPQPDAEDLHHLLRVLRLRDGEAVGLSDGQGAWRLGRLVLGAGRSDADLEVVGPVQVDPLPTPTITVGLALPKGDRAEWAVQKLTELGVDAIAVLDTERSVVRWEGDRAETGLARLSRVARQAAAQSRRTRLPTISGPLRVADFATATTAAAEPGAPAGPSLRQPTVLVGPEGGWGESELPSEMARVALGPGVLRTETACLAAANLLVGLRSGLIGPIPL